MAPFPEIEAQDAARQAEQFWRLPIGAASPFWAAYAGMASVGVAYWWMSRWIQPINLEAFAFRSPMLPALRPTTAPVVAETLAALQPEPAAPPLDRATSSEEDAAVETAEATVGVVTQMTEQVGEAAVAMSLAADDLTRLVGIGPTLATKLADMGVRTFADIASWTEEDLAKVDDELDLKGRAVREAWVDQARQFASQ